MNSTLNHVCDIPVVSTVCSTIGSTVSVASSVVSWGLWGAQNAYWIAPAAIAVNKYFRITDTAKRVFDACATYLVNKYADQKIDYTPENAELFTEMTDFVMQNSESYAKIGENDRKMEAVRQRYNKFDDALRTKWLRRIQLAQQRKAGAAAKGTLGRVIAELKKQMEAVKFIAPRTSGLPNNPGWNAQTFKSELIKQLKEQEYTTAEITQIIKALKL